MVTFGAENLLVFGGTCDHIVNNDLYKYNLKAKMWTRLEPIYEEGHLPSPREGHVSVMVATDQMLVHGGIDENEICFSDCYILTGLNNDLDFN
jgi:N-acetylneuraminic acid mutarotase